MNKLLDILDRRIAEASKREESPDTHEWLMAGGIRTELEAVRAELAAELAGLEKQQNHQPDLLNQHQSKLQFTAEDFASAVVFGCDSAEHCVDAANAKLQAWLEKAPEVFGIFDPCEIALLFSAQRQIGDTHKARLVDVTPLVATDKEKK